MKRNKKWIEELTECPCTGKTLERLIRPAILLILTDGTLYGYKIIQRLAKTRMFKNQKPNVAGVYRCLKTMAAEKLVVASWGLSKAGPAKRLYTLTEQGEKCLASWSITLHGYREALDELLARAQKAIRRLRAS